MTFRVTSELRIENRKGRRIEIGTKAEFVGFHMNVLSEFAEL